IVKKAKNQKDFIMRLYQNTHPSNVKEPSAPKVLQTISDFHLVTEEIIHITQLVKLIWENQNDNTCVELIDDGTLQFSTVRSSSQAYQVGTTHPAQMPLVGFALGILSGIKDTFDNKVEND